MACNSLFSCNLIRDTYNRPVKHLNSSLPFLSTRYVPCKYNARELSLPSVASIPYQPINVDNLEGEFSVHGVTFERIGDDFVTKMKLKNGSTATLMLPSGLITSYKGKMWHGGTVELLQTSVSKGKDDEAVIEGGVSVELKMRSDGEAEWWSPTTWSLRNVRGNPRESIQVELISSDPEGMIEVKYIVNLQQDILSSDIEVSNSKSSSIQLTGFVMSHLIVSTPEATYVTGLEGSDFFTRPPVSSHFSIVLPQDKVNDFGIGQILSSTPLKGLVNGWEQTSQINADKSKRSQTESEEDLEGEEDDNYKHLAEKMSRFYKSAPRYFTIIDRGRRNSVLVGREGFDELYMFSPGSSYEFYGKYAYICVGQSALLKAITLGPGDVWSGGQKLHNPNL